ncbi:SDR family NAD(P)-dependent oxidoreductase [Corynebacterium pyruviciproducens]|uniref:SDR family NAD(P)-dependent oxidoreductase n=1 Tax=Corynebacterium pyruviciproducens TaxID=598660 RepID=UPI0023F0070F|nr:SDR family NAD(P)-dependent oxidoreductase [Corynebacterium pyruviciproducens]MDH4658946.1 SDR family NAD(P)-dependent oxidoreductase [Corynebacterium pyruviciproducens]
MRILITGASSGIGKSAALKLQERGHEVIGVGRNEDRLKEVTSHYYRCDFTDLSSVRGLVEQLRAENIDALALNAGGILPSGGLTADGFDPTWQVNVLANFLIMHELQPAGPVIWTSSIAQYGGPAIVPEEVPYDRASASDFDVYAQSKRACALIAYEAARRGLRAASFHPGVISSNFGITTKNDLTPLYNLPATKKVLASPEMGGDRLAELLSGEVLLSGSYYVTRIAGKFIPGHVRDTNIARTLWEQSEHLLGL